MTEHMARSLGTAGRRVLVGENNSQDSQEKLLFLIQEHGIGVTTSLPIPRAQSRRATEETTGAPISFPAVAAADEKRLRRPQIGNASKAAAGNADEVACSEIDADAVAFTLPEKNPTHRHRESQSVPSTISPARAVEAPAPSIPRHVRPADEPPDLQTRDDAAPQPPPSSALLKKRPRIMSSQSTTQSNEGRSYDQYARERSQPSSPPGSAAEDHPTLQEGDTGYVNFKYPFDMPDTAPMEPDTPSTCTNEQSQFTTQPATARTDRFAPETPATFPRPFIASGIDQVMPASQLFGQTQPTSALKKVSPTSSKPSPNIYGKNVTSPTQPPSSPLKNRGGFSTTPLSNFASTSPGFPEDLTRPLDARASQPSSPVDEFGVTEDRDEDEIDKTTLPKLNPRRVRGLQPIDEYRPYRKQVVGSDVTKSSSQHSLDSDFDREEAELRHQRARSRKERATRSFPEISVPLPASGRATIEVPSTNRAKCAEDCLAKNSEPHLTQRRGKYDIGNDGSQETVVDSQDATIWQAPTDKNDAPIPPARDAGKLSHRDHGRPSNAPVGATEKETVPETSPACTYIEQPKPFGDMLGTNSSDASNPVTLSYPLPSTVASAEPLDSLNEASHTDCDASASLVTDKPTIGPIAFGSSPSIIPASSQQSAKRRSSRLAKHTALSSVAPELLPSDPDTTSSELTVYSATPVISSSLTPNTDVNENDDAQGTTVAASSSTVERRQRPGSTPSLPEPSTPLTKTKVSSRTRQSFRKGARQSSRHSSVSLDELDKSPSISAAEGSRSITRKPPRKSTTLREFQARCGLFEGMVFAISFQERQQPSKGKDKSFSKSSLEDLIRQEGGRILDDGFNSLFEFDTLPLAKTSFTAAVSSSLKLLNSEIGFTALIADGHSRKVKYMQALALGIPCLAPKWVATCVTKGKLVDWSSYLLCAGSSTLLGDAIRSRNLPPYDASTAKLARVIAHRPKLLDESNILLIMKKTKNEEKRLPYVFLAQVLGASLARVNSVEEARAKLRETESGNNSFNWVYVDDHLQDTKIALFGAGPSDVVSRKRKRASMSADVDDLPPKRIRTLNDELVIQSLILGRLIEEDEMED